MLHKTKHGLCIEGVSKVHSEIEKKMYCQPSIYITIYMIMDLVSTILEVYSDEYQYDDLTTLEIKTKGQKVGL